MPNPSHKKTDADTTLQDLKDATHQFRAERGWDRHNTGANLAMSITIEAAELLEHFQWGNEDTEANKQKIAHELADIINYCMSFASTMDIDVSTAFFDKLEHIKKKYPTSIFNPDNKDLEAYHKIKKSYRESKES